MTKQQEEPARRDGNTGKKPLETQKKNKSRLAETRKRARGLSGRGTGGGADAWRRENDEGASRDEEMGKEPVETEKRKKSPREI